MSVNFGFATLLLQAPLYLVWGLGAILALRLLPRQPKAAWLALAGLGVFFARSVAGTLLGWWLPEIASALRVSMSVAIYGRSLMDVAVAAVGWGLILGAIFAGRPRS